MISVGTALVRALNDKLRVHHQGGRILITRGILDVGSEFTRDVLYAVARFDHFEEGNDPYDEHDFGSLTVCAKTVFWKIDYYAHDMQGGASDPIDCVRVLTIMLAEEY